MATTSARVFLRLGPAALVLPIAAIVSAVVTGAHHSREEGSVQ
jgi:hypothetical protein